MIKLFTALFVFLWASALFGAEAYKFTTIAVPEARHTIPYGISDVGDIVGVYVDCDMCKPQSFLFSDDQYFDVNVPGYTRMVPFGINRDGIIAGTLISNQGQVAVILDGETTTILDQAPRADAINNHGAVVGYRTALGLDQIAYKWKAGVYTEIVTPAHVPGILGSAATGINGRGDIVGYWFDNVKITGFVRRAGVITPLVDFMPFSINNDGVIAGYSGAGRDGALLVDGVVTFIKFPEADYTEVHSINNKGVVLGYYIKAGINYGFFATPLTARQIKRLAASVK